MLVVLDTNVIVSGLAYPHSVPGQIVGMWRKGNVNVATSLFLLAEVERILPKMRPGSWNQAEVQSVVQELRSHCVMVQPANAVEATLRDAQDLPVLGTLIAAEANCLITGDKDLLALRDLYPVLTPAEFLRRLTTE